MLSQVEYIWLDGAEPTRKLRSKTRIMKLGENPQISDIPEWGFDGSSTNQSSGDNSDLVLRPVYMVPDSTKFRHTDGPNFLVLAEVFNEDGTPHPSNTRAKLREKLDKIRNAHEPWIGFEQEFTLFGDNDQPLGWPERGFPAPQGPFYCGVGNNQVHGRNFIEAHTEACLDSGLMIFGINAEVMPAQWEYQIGPRGIEGESGDPLFVSDQHWLARWMLYKLGEVFGVEPSLENKPVKGDWNGAGQHTNFSTKAMRDPKTGQRAIEEAIVALSKNHDHHVQVYGHGLEERLTGLHETCAISEFKSGIADRGASIRIPRSVAQKGYGYIEDRRPGANADPYEISLALIETICS